MAREVRIRISGREKWYHLNQVKKYEASHSTIPLWPTTVPRTDAADVEAGGAEGHDATAEDATVQEEEVEDTRDTGGLQPNIAPEPVSTHPALSRASEPCMEQPSPIPEALSFLPAESRSGRRVKINPKYQ